MNESAVTGVPHLFEVHRTSTVGTGGTAITGMPSDTTNAALPSQITARSSPTGGATSAGLLFYIATNPEETLAAASVHAGINWMPEGDSITPIVLNEGQGISVNQITSSTVGVWTALLVVTVE